MESPPQGNKNVQGSNVRGSKLLRGEQITHDFNAGINLKTSARLFEIYTTTLCMFNVLFYIVFIFIIYYIFMARIYNEEKQIVLKKRRIDN